MAKQVLVSPDTANSRRTLNSSTTVQKRKIMKNGGGANTGLHVDAADRAVLGEEALQVVLARVEVEVAAEHRPHRHASPLLLPRNRGRSHPPPSKPPLSAWGAERRGRCEKKKNPHKSIKRISQVNRPGTNRRVQEGTCRDV
jgi:hypothetical protein